MDLIFATNNPSKIREMQAIIGKSIHMISLQEAGVNIELAEPFDTLEANASAKSKVIAGLAGRDCFSEDTGLEVEALDGRPGVKTARYAGEHATARENIEKLLAEIKDHQGRNAQFRTIISLRLDEKEHQFEGICRGKITQKPAGKGGFGYDPVFIPWGFSKTFAEMTEKEKTKLSHRAMAARKMVAFLNDYQQKLT